MSRHFCEFSSDNFNETLNHFIGFRKCTGLLTASMCNLPIVKSGFVVFGEVKQDDILCLRDKYGKIVMCRIDAPAAAWHRLPRGRDLNIGLLNQYYKTIRDSSISDFILLCFKHPSLYYSGEMVERWDISGGITVLIIWGKQIIIEYVGKGFDVGELTRGITIPHQRLIMTWPTRHEASTIWNNSTKWCIDEKKYYESREIRLKALSEMGYNRTQAEEHIPETFQPFSFLIFEQLFSNCIIPVLEKRKLFSEEKIITILINLYHNSFHVFEIWEQ